MASILQQGPPTHVELPFKTRKHCIRGHRAREIAQLGCKVLSLIPRTKKKKKLTKYFCCFCLSFSPLTLLTPTVSTIVRRLHRSTQATKTNLHVGSMSAFPLAQMVLTVKQLPQTTLTLKETGWPQSSFPKMADWTVVGLEVQVDKSTSLIQCIS